MFALLASLLVAPFPADTALPLRGEAPAIRLTINGSGDYNPGERVRVQVEAAEDGYVVVFRVDGDGRVRVLFPIDPDVDPFIRGGRRYELRGRAERETFLADDRGGAGMLYAAISRTPLTFAAFTDQDHWDYSTLRLADSTGDAEAGLNGLFRSMAGTGRFEYDVLGYRVISPVYISGGAGVAANDPAYYGGALEDPYFDCLSCGYGVRHSGVSIHVGLGNAWNRWGGYDRWNRCDPWWDDPWSSYCDRWYGYGYGYGGYDPYWGGWWYPGQYRPITVINLPRRPQTPDPVYGYRSRPRMPVGGSGLGDGAIRPDPRPVRTEERGRARNDEQPSRVSRPAGDRPAPVFTPAPSRPTGGGTEPSRARRPGGDPAPMMDRRGDDEPRKVDAPRPVFREPAPRDRDAATRGRDDRRGDPVAQPVYREPARTERPATREAPPARAEPPKSSAPPRNDPPKSEPAKNTGSSNGRARGN